MKGKSILKQLAQRELDLEGGLDPCLEEETSLDRRPLNIELIEENFEASRTFGIGPDAMNQIRSMAGAFRTLQPDGYREAPPVAYPLTIKKGLKLGFEQLVGKDGITSIQHEITDRSKPV